MSFRFVIFFLFQTMSYRKHGFWVLIERCFKQTAMKYVNYSIKLSPYGPFCCPLPLISALSSANISVSPQFFGEFDMLTFTPPTFWKTSHSQFFSFPVLRSQLENLLKPPKSHWVGIAWAVARRFVPLANRRAEKTIAIVFQIHLQLVRAKSSFQSPDRT